MLADFNLQYVVRFLAGQRSTAIDAGYIAHPSFVTEDELAAIQKPLAISASGAYLLCFGVVHWLTNDRNRRHLHKRVATQVGRYPCKDRPAIPDQFI